MEVDNGCYQLSTRLQSLTYSSPPRPSTDEPRLGPEKLRGSLSLSLPPSACPSSLTYPHTTATASSTP